MYTDHAKSIVVALTLRDIPSVLMALIYLRISLDAYHAFPLADVSTNLLHGVVFTVSSSANAQIYRDFYFYLKPGAWIQSAGILI